MFALSASVEPIAYIPEDSDHKNNAAKVVPKELMTLVLYCTDKSYLNHCENL